MWEKEVNYIIQKVFYIYGKDVGEEEVKLKINNQIKNGYTQLEKDKLIKEIIKSYE